MPHALIPDGFTLKKVTKSEERAVDAFRRQENIEAFLGNPRTPLLIGGLAIGLSAPLALRLIFKALSKQQLGIPEDISSVGVDYVVFAKDFTEAILELRGAGGLGGDPFEGEIEDFFKKYVKR